MVRGEDLAMDGDSVDVRRWSKVALRTLTAQGVTLGHLDILFVGEDEMARLNRIHMGQSGPTDVLSFPLDEAKDHGDVPLHLGDVVICPAMARGQMLDHAGTEEAEFALLTIHGVLHILGHDHAEDEDALIMQRAERQMLAALGFSHPIAE